MGQQLELSFRVLPYLKLELARTGDIIFMLYKPVKEFNPNTGFCWITLGIIRKSQKDELIYEFGLEFTTRKSETLLEACKQMISTFCNNSSQMNDYFKKNDFLFNQIPTDVTEFTPIMPKGSPAVKGQITNSIYQ